jgi:hypothetical protein
MMSNRLLKLSVVVLVAGLGLALVQSRVQAEHDLDSYPDSILERDLSDELDDIYAQLDDPDGEYDLDSLKSDILNALGDDGDEGDEEEMEIDLADLNQEMDEAGTTVDSVVDEALARADELASRRGSPSWTIVQATFSGLSLNAQSRDRRTKPRVAIDQTVKTVRVYIRRAR